MNTTFTPIKIAVVGTGNVGASFAYALTLSGLASEIVLIDANAAKAQGEAMDLVHSAPFAQATKVSAGDYDACAGCAVTVVTAGANQKPGESRLELGRKNAGIFGQIIPSIVKNNPDGLIVIATNPVDVLTQVSAQMAGFAPGRVFGSGTILDTARFPPFHRPTRRRRSAERQRLYHRRTRRQFGARVELRDRRRRALRAVLRGDERRADAGD